jgi:hypothetical protein
VHSWLCPARGWYTLQFAAGDVVITSHDPVPL